MNKPNKKARALACITAAVILALLFALPITAAVTENFLSAAVCEEVTRSPIPATLTAVVKTKHLSAAVREEVTRSPIPAAPTAVVKAKCLSAAVCEEVTRSPNPAALTAVVKVKCLSAYTEAIGGEGYSADGELMDLWERFLEILPPELRDFALQLDEYGSAKIGELILTSLTPVRSDLARLAALLVAMMILYAACELLPERHRSVSDAAGAALSALLAIPTLAIIISFVGSSADALRSSSEFFGELIPIMTSAAAVGIGGGTAALTASVSAVALGLCEGVVLSGVYPLFALVFTLAVLEGLDTGRTVASFSAGVRKLVTMLCGTAPIVIGSVLSLGTLISASRDTLALRGAKYALSGMVPVVGNVISGSIGALISGCKLLAGVVGPLAVCAFLYYLAAPLLSLLAIRFLFSLASGAAEMLGAARGARLFGNLCGALDAIIAPIGASALIYVFEIVIFISAVSGVSV